MRRLLHKLPLLFVLSTILSCNPNSNHQADIATLQLLQETLTESNNAVTRATTITLDYLEGRTYDPETSVKAGWYHPKAKQVMEMTVNTVKYIEVIKTLLKKQAGISDSTSTTDKAWSNVAAVNDLFSRQQRGRDLYKTLQQYRSGIFGIDAVIVKEFSNNLIITSPAFDRQSSKDFTTEFLHDIPVIAATCILTKFQGNIWLIANKTIAFLSSRMAWHPVSYIEPYYPLLSQSSTGLLPGEYIELTAGVGSINLACKPAVAVNKKEVPITAEGVALIKFRVPKQPGKYSKVVEISYNDQDGIRRTIAKGVYYTVFNKDSTAH